MQGHDEITKRGTTITTWALRCCARCDSLGDPDGYMAIGIVTCAETGNLDKVGLIVSTGVS